MSAMPLPRSENVRRKPRRAPTSSASSSTSPPPPWINVLRASSLAAVTSLVWSTRPKPSSVDHCRTSWRTRTTSSSDLTSETSRFIVLIADGLRADAECGLQQLHPTLHVQCGAHALQGHTEL